MKKLILLFSVLFTTMSFAQVPSYVPANGLVGWWPFNGNANDESGNGNNGVLIAPVLANDRFLNANSAYTFDGIDDYIDAGTSPNLYFSSGVSISAWVNTNNVGYKIAEKQQDSPPYLIYQYFIHGTGQVGVGLRIDASNSAYTFSNELISLNQWSHVVFSWQKDINGGLCRIYINGQEATYSTQTPLNGDIAILSSLSTKFGADIYPPLLEAPDGILDDIGIWNRALTDCEIQNLYTSTNPTNLTSQTACNSYTWNGTTYNSSGVYTGTTTNCVTESLDLTITPSSTNTSTISACDSYLWNGTNYSESGVYTGTTTDCVTQSLNLTITPSSTNTTPISACDSYLWNGTNYSESGVYTGTTANCVTESLDLTITPSSSNTTTASACNSYVWNGTTYTESGVYTGTTANCITESLDLTITPSSTNTTTASACDSYLWNGTNYTSSGVYTGTTTNCIAESLNLTITQTFSDTTIAIACDSYTWNGQTYTESGTYTGITENCITQSLKLTINPSTSSSISQTALDSYTWPVNNQTYTTTGAYTAVIPNTSGCDSTITLNLTMSFTGINDLSTSKLSIYPNPTNGDFTITGLELVGTVSSLSLTDMNGKVLKVLDTKATKFSMAAIKPGVYFLNIISGNKQEVLKIVKE
jgi:hypothetical protein